MIFFRNPRTITIMLSALSTSDWYDLSRLTRLYGLTLYQTARKVAASKRTGVYLNCGVKVVFRGNASVALYKLRMSGQHTAIDIPNREFADSMFHKVTKTDHPAMNAKFCIMIQRIRCNSMRPQGRSNSDRKRFLGFKLWHKCSFFADRFGYVCP